MKNYPFKILISYVNSDGVIFRKVTREIHNYKEYGRLSSDLVYALNYCSGHEGYCFLTQYLYPHRAEQLLLFKDSDFQVFD